MVCRGDADGVSDRQDLGCHGDAGDGHGDRRPRGPSFVPESDVVAREFRGPAVRQPRVADADLLVGVLLRAWPAEPTRRRRRARDQEEQAGRCRVRPMSGPATSAGSSGTSAGCGTSTRCQRPRSRTPPRRCSPVVTPKWGPDHATWASSRSPKVRLQRERHQGGRHRDEARRRELLPEGAHPRAVVPRRPRSGPFHPLTTDQTFEYVGMAELGFFDPPAAND